MRAVLVACLIAGCAGEPAPEGWHVAGGALRDPAGRTVILRGMNVSGRHKQAPYLDFHEAADFVRLHDDWGMNAVRFLVSWAGLEPEPGVYDEAYLAAIADRLAAARDAGLLVVVDMHQDVYGVGFGPIGNGAPRWTCDEARYTDFVPRTPWFASYGDPNVLACVDGFWASADLRAHYVEAWRRLARALADNPAVIGFDPMNEPYWGSATINLFEADLLSPLYAEVAAAVRGEAPDWIGFLEPSAGRNLGISNHLDVSAIPDVVYAPHSYDAAAEAGGGFDDQRRAAVLGNVAEMRDEANALGAALWIGEYGGMTNTAGIVPYMDAGYDAAAAALAGSMYWHYGRDPSYGVLDENGAEKPELLDVLVRPYPERISGDLIGWSYDETTRVLLLEIVPAPGTSVLSVPARVYPDGANVECGGCTVLAEDGRVQLSGAVGELLRVSPR